MLSLTTVTWPFYWCTAETGAGFSRVTVPINSSSRCSEQDVSTSFRHTRSFSGGQQRRAVLQMKTQTFKGS